MEHTCKKCGETKPIEEFYNSRFASGDYESCRTCLAAEQVEIYERTKKEAKKKTKKKYRKLHPEVEKKREKKNREKLADKYIKKIIRRYFNIKGELPSELIENWRQQIKLKRLIKTMKNENTTNG
jgi:nucleosome binding factor SPN SPT16 subunit